jgi:alpha-glucosidase
MALAMVMFLRGTPVFYYGEEIGMRDAPPPPVEEFLDGLGVWFYHELLHTGVERDEAYQAAAAFCRDRCRTPMQWSSAPNAGFSPAGVETWLPASGDHARGTNVEDQQADPDSMLSFFRQIVQVRQEHLALRRGELEIVPGTGDVLAFWRRAPGQSLLVVLNMSAQASELQLDAALDCLIYTNYPGNRGDNQTQTLALQPYEIWIGESR